MNMTEVSYYCSFSDSPPWIADEEKKGYDGGKGSDSPPWIADEEKKGYDGGKGSDTPPWIASPMT